MPFAKVAKVGEVPPGKGTQVTINGRKIGLFNVGGRFYAIEDQCTHRGAPLSEGECEGTEIICPWHGAVFDLATGAARTPPASVGVATFPVQVLGDEVHVDVP